MHTTHDHLTKYRHHYQYYTVCEQTHVYVLYIGRSIQMHCRNSSCYHVHMRD